MAGLPSTPKLDELEKGRWPSFVKEIKMAAKKSPMAADLLGQLEQSYNEGIGHWKHGGIVGVMGYGGGVIGRYSDLPEKWPNISHFHTMRINHPSGWYYTSDALRKICDIWEKRGSSLTNMHGSTGDIILLGTTTDELEPVFSDLQKIDFIGSGVLMFPVDTLLALEKPWFDEAFVPKDYRRVASMDTRFVFNLKAQGGAHVWCDTTIKVRHLSIFEIDDTYQERFTDWTELEYGECRPKKCTSQS